MLKYGGHGILNSLKNLFNFILNIGQFSYKWNDRFLVLLHNFGSKMDPSKL